jgi:hypothetical protein
MNKELFKINSILDKYEFDSDTEIVIEDEEDRRIIKKFIKFLSEKIGVKLYGKNFQGV